MPLKKNRSTYDHTHISNQEIVEQEKLLTSINRGQDNQIRGSTDPAVALLEIRQRQRY